MTRVMGTLLVSALSALLLLLINITGTDLFLQRSPLPCKDIIGENIALQGSYQCEARGTFSKINYLISESLLDETVPNEIVIRPANQVTGTRVSFYFQSDGNGSFYVYELSNLETPADTSFIDVYNLSGKNPGTMVIGLPARHPGVVIKFLGGRSQMLFADWRQMSDPTLTQFAIVKQKTSQSGCNYFFWLLITIVLASGSYLLWKLAPSGHRIYLACLVTLFFLLSLFYGAPYISNAGFYDTFDDKSYLDWANAIGYRLDGDLTKNDFASQAQKDNHHSFGTGLLLAPGMTLTRLFFPQGNGFNNYGFTAVALNSSLLTLLSLILYYLAFSHFAPKAIALLASFLTLAVTSLIKWTFVRNFFSHSAEAFTLASMTYFFVKIYIAENRSLRFYFGFTLFGVLATVVRKENALLLLVPVFYELFTSTYAPLLNRLRKCALFFAGFIGAFALICISNAFTEAQHIWVIPGGGLIQFDNMWESVQKKALPVIFGEEFGLFSWWNFCAWLSLGAIFALRKKPKLLAIPIGLVCGYLVMCILQIYPNGVEWQNRFLLKLNPFIFGGVALVLAGMHARRFSKALVFILILLTFNIVNQYHMFIANHPAFAPLYRDFLSDFAIFFPVPFVERPRLYFVPPIFFGLTALGLWSLVLAKAKFWQLPR